MTSTRRTFVQNCSILTTCTLSAAPAPGPNAVVIDLKPLFDISPYLYMQFFEPLGTADPGAEAAWDYEAGDWRKDLVDVTRDLSPGVIRWGSILTRYYK